MGDLTKEFIETILREHEKDQTIQVTNFISSPACKTGENFMSSVKRVKIEGKRKVDDIFHEFKRSLIVKHPLESEMMRNVFKSNEMFANEALVYNKIVPILQEGYKISLPVAQCLFANNEVIVLEDLSSDGYFMNRGQVSMTIDQIIAVLQELAVVHASSIILNHRDSTKINDISMELTELYTPDNIIIEDMVKNNIEIALHQLRAAPQTSKIINTTERLEKCKDQIYPRVCDLIATNKYTKALNHGDCWRNNILFKTTRSGIKVKLIDLQGLRLTSVAADLSYFLYINLPTHKRNENFNVLLDSYISALQRALREHEELNIAYTLYNKDWLEREMTDFEVFGFMFSMWIAPAFYFKDTDISNNDSILVDPERLDLEAQKKVILSNMTPELSDRMISLVVDFVHKYNF